MSRMHNPAHPGRILHYWIPDDMSVTEAAQALQINRVTLSKILNGRGNVTANIAMRLSEWLGTTPDVWLKMQNNWDMWQTSQQPRPRIEPLARRASGGAQAALAR